MSEGSKADKADARRLAELLRVGMLRPVYHGHEAVRELNARFRDKDRPTNVLSFPAPESAAPHLGDIVLAYGVCASEAQAQGKTLSDHLSHLVVHGVLHLLGRDHEDDAEAEEMEAEEREILAELGVSDPYAADSSDSGQDA